MKTLFISAGEVSGDFYGASLVPALKSIDNSIEIIGIGGSLMGSAGVAIIRNWSHLSSVGIIESIIPGIAIFIKSYQVKQFVKKNKIDLVLLIDHQGFNIPFAQFCKKNKIPVIYYFPPHVSIWGKWNGKKLMNIAQHLFTPYFKDYEIYRKYGEHVTLIKHPLLSIIYKFNINEPSYQSHQKQDSINIGLFPGSRVQEIKRLLPILIKTALLLKKQINHVTFIIPVPDIFKKMVSNYIPCNEQIFFQMIQQGDYSAYSQCHFAIACSGTVTLELALLKIPFLVIYRLHPISYFIAKLVVKNPIIAMPNIILNKKVAPELIQNEATSENLFQKTMEMISNKDALLNQVKGYSCLEKYLGKGDSIDQIASFLIHKMNSTEILSN